MLDPANRNVGRLDYLDGSSEGHNSSGCQGHHRRGDYDVSTAEATVARTSFAGVGCAVA
jgi:hypothetical protein